MRDRSTARWSARLRIAGAIVTAQILVSCSPAPEPARQEQPGKIIVMMRAGPTSYFPGVDGLPAGIDHDLLVGFAREHHLEVELVEASDADAIVAAVARGEAHIGAGGLVRGTRPVSGDEAPLPAPLWTSAYHAVEPLLIYEADSFVPRSFRDLDGASVAYVARSGVDDAIEEVRARYPKVLWQAADAPSTDALIAQVSEGDVDYAVVASTDIAAARNVYLDFDIAFPVGSSHELAWAVAPGRAALKEELDGYFARLRRSGQLARLADRYLARTRQIARASTQTRSRTRCALRCPRFGRCSRKRRRSRASTGASLPRSRTRNRNGTPARRARPVRVA
jgi:membrane-bound lytic murein transglycosylase F